MLRTNYAMSLKYFERSLFVERIKTDHIVIIIVFSINSRHDKYITYVKITNCAKTSATFTKYHLIVILRMDH